MANSVTHRRARSRRDEQDTRGRLLEVAGQVFAEKGVDRATGKEICARAGTNAAAINYHFGSFDRLYAAVLCEAHQRVATLESLQSAVAAVDGAQAKLQAVMRLIVQSLTGPISSSWVVRVLAREIVAPSPAISILREQEARPKMEVVRRIVAELMDLPENHPAVARGSVSVMAPCFMLLVADRRTFKRLFPRFELAPGNSEAIVQHLVRFAVAGLSAVAGDKAPGRRNRSTRCDPSSKKTEVPGFRREASRMRKPCDQNKRRGVSRKETGESGRSASGAI